MKNIIYSSKNALILLPEKLCFDTASAALGLAQSITYRNRKVTIGTAQPLPKSFEKILDFSQFKIVNEVERKEVILSLNRKEGKVKAVRWREIDDKIQFIITPDEGDFEYDDVDLEAVGGEYDLVICIGCETLKHAGSAYSSNQTFFNSANILNIDINPRNSKYGTENKVSKEEQSLSSYVLKLIEEEKLKLTKEAAETLFKGVFWASEGFRDDTNLKKALEKLISSGGELTTTIPSIFDTLTPDQLNYIGHVISNMVIDEDDIITSAVSSSQTKGIKLDEIIYPEINIISRLRDYKAALILSEYEEGKILVKAYSGNENLNLLDTFSEYSAIGTPAKVTFHSEEALIDLKEKLLATLKKSSLSKPEVDLSDTSDSQVVFPPDQDNSEDIKKKESNDKSKNDKEKKSEDPKTEGKELEEPLKKASSPPEALDVDTAAQVETGSLPTAAPFGASTPMPQRPIYPNQPLPPAS